MKLVVIKRMSDKQEITRVVVDDAQRVLSLLDTFLKVECRDYIFEVSDLHMTFDEALRLGETTQTQQLQVDELMCFDTNRDSLLCDETLSEDEDV